MLAASNVISNMATSSIGGFSPSASTTPFGSLTFDLGSAKQIDGLALWNLSAGAPAGLRGLSLFADDDADFSNGTTAGLGAFTLPGSYPFSGTGRSAELRRCHHALLAIPDHRQQRLPDHNRL